MKRAQITLRGVRLPDGETVPWERVVVSTQPAVRRIRPDGTLGDRLRLSGGAAGARLAARLQRRALRRMIRDGSLDLTDSTPARVRRIIIIECVVILALCPLIGWGLIPILRYGPPSHPYAILNTWLLVANAATLSCLGVLFAGARLVVGMPVTRSVRLTSDRIEIERFKGTRASVAWSDVVHLDNHRVRAHDERTLRIRHGATTASRHPLIGGLIRPDLVRTSTWRESLFVVACATPTAMALVLGLVPFESLRLLVRPETLGPTDLAMPGMMMLSLTWGGTLLVLLCASAALADFAPTLRPSHDPALPTGGTGQARAHNPAGPPRRDPPGAQAT